MVTVLLLCLRMRVSFESLPQGVFASYRQIAKYFRRKFSCRVLEVRAIVTAGCCVEHEYGMLDLCGAK